MSTVNFFTPIESQDNFQSFVDNYFHLCGKKAHIVHVDQENKKAVLIDSQPSFLCTLLKIVSYCTVILPIVMLVAKVISRSMLPAYEIDETLSADMEAINAQSPFVRLTTILGLSPEESLALHDFHARKGILRNPAKEIISPIEIEMLIRDLPIDWNETMHICPNRYQKAFAPFVESANLVTFKEAFTDFVNRMNAKIAAQVREGGPVYNTLQRQRFVVIFETLQKIDEGPSYFYKYSNPMGKSWSDRILQILLENGHISEVGFGTFQA